MQALLDQAGAQLAKLRRTVRAIRPQSGQVIRRTPEQRNQRIIRVPAVPTRTYIGARQPHGRSNRWFITGGRGPRGAHQQVRRVIIAIRHADGPERTLRSSRARSGQVPAWRSSASYPAHRVGAAAVKGELLRRSPCMSGEPTQACQAKAGAALRLMIRRVTCSLRRTDCIPSCRGYHKPDCANLFVGSGDGIVPLNRLRADDF